VRAGVKRSLTALARTEHQAALDALGAASDDAPASSRGSRGSEPNQAPGGPESGRASSRRGSAKLDALVAATAEDLVGSRRGSVSRGSASSRRGSAGELVTQGLGYAMERNPQEDKTRVRI